MKFAHLGDCHLGGWSQQELRDLNFKAFQYAINLCIKKKVEFVLISGDLFDSAYPPIETLKEAFYEFKRLKEAGISVFLIAGSHDYSASGKTFLDVLESAGLCKNVSLFEEHNGKIMLYPTQYKNVAIYGYPGRKSGLEVDDVNRVKIQDSPGLFKILMLHTVIKDAIGNLPIPSVDEKNLPEVDYVALSHLHINYKRENRVYSGPIFPNNLLELEELKEGSFYFYEYGKVIREPVKLKEVLAVTLEITNALNATEQIIKYIETQSIKDKILILKLEGIIGNGKISDIDFKKIEQIVREKGAFSFLKSITKLHHAGLHINVESADSVDLEPVIVDKFINSNPNKYSSLINPLIRSLQASRMEEEKLSVFEDRLLAEIKKIIPL
ncbi:MAG: DNA repair exonuclease [Nanoarchaeota archaeon]